MAKKIKTRLLAVPALAVLLLPSLLLLAPEPAKAQSCGGPYCGFQGIIYEIPPDYCAYLLFCMDCYGNFYYEVDVGPCYFA